MPSVILHADHTLPALVDPHRRTPTDFGMVRREAMDLTKLLMPTLQQKLYSELNKKLIEVSEVSRRERRQARGHV